MAESGTKTASKLLSEAREGRGMMGLFKRAGVESDELATVLTRAGNGADDVAAMIAAPNAASTGFNPAAVPDSDDVRSAGTVGRIAANAPTDAEVQMAAMRGANRTNPNATGQASRTSAAVVGDEGSFFKAMQPVESVLETGSTVLDVGQLAVDFALPAVGGLVGLTGATKAKEILNAPHNYLNKQDPKKPNSLTKGDHLNNGLMLGVSALGVFGVAKGFTQNLDSLKHMYSDLTGVPRDNVSTMTIITGNVPDAMKEARAHFVKEFASRGLINGIGLGLVARTMLKGKVVGWIEGLVPTFAGMGLDALMGESVTPYYANLANAHRAGQQIPPQAYSEFLIAASDDLKRRGKIGQRMAILLGEEFAAERASPAAIMKEINDSMVAHKRGGKAKFDERIDAILSKIEAQKAQKHEPVPKVLEAPQPAAVVDAVKDKNAKAERKVYGKYTKQVQRSELTEVAPGTPVIQGAR